ncbi:1-acyl-sn-glycerol-3-phosphate acyltransferase [Halosquirtibacter xylanolyticus]|uniref:glycerol acyltransferase n=1 Tax=Halosquirtibacter xylanolyticus TaxID=3374599 RepID=UPI003748CE3D|nr:1-acyl-sn-glycerol-3-phosphate acyltransferase [Prolixibacteraceae bacterium]
MDLNKKYEEIRPYRDHEIKEVVATLLKDDSFHHVFEKLFPNKQEREMFLDIFASIETVIDFQYKIIRPLVDRVADMSTDGVQFLGKENFDYKKCHVFISNHRDIVLDPAFLNVGAIKQDIRATEIAIGSNLLIYDWITHLVKMNRSFVVKRDIPVKQMLAASENLSGYIRSNITERDQSVWIAQKEGRTKNGIDRTQVALLKMLNISNNHSSTRQGFIDLDIVPMSLSYEIEPCGGLKVLELLRKKYEPDYKKQPGEDLQSMGTGIIAPKGRVVFQFSEPINPTLLATEEVKNKNKQLKVVADILDQAIISNYKLWPFNFIAFDRVNNTDRFSNEYTSEDIEKFDKLTEESLSIIDFKQDEALQLWLEMYANPVQSKIEFNCL